MSAIVRFAPSPTGLLHVGNARIALINWLLTKKVGGQYILRIDDTDTARSKAEYVTAIEQDLAWLGVTWDRKVHQSDRFDKYDAVAQQLKDMGRLYPCYETPEDLDLKRKLQRARGKPPVYDRSALKLTDEDKAALEAEGRTPHWRFRLDHEDVTWVDQGRGACSYNGAHLSDPILIRGDGSYLYTLPSVLDDMEMGITHIVRGEDHVTNAAAQIQIFAALGAEPPTFAHLPLLTGAEGEGLSKRLGSLSLGELRDGGAEALALASLLAKMGTSDAVEAVSSMQDLVETFDIAKFGRASPKFDPRELAQLTAKVLHAMSFEEASARLEEPVDRVFWEAVRPNLESLGDVTAWWDICRGAITPVIEDADFCAQAADLLPPEPWGPETWKAFTGAVKDATGRKGKMLFMPLRQALTGMDHGPELKDLLPLIGRGKAQSRLRGKVS